MSDFVFATCSQMAAKFRKDKNNVHVFPPGVDMSAFPDETALTGNICLTVSSCHHCRDQSLVTSAGCTVLLITIWSPAWLARAVVVMGLSRSPPGLAGETRGLA